MTHPAISSESEKSPFTGLDNSINSKFLMAILESLIDSMKENALVMSMKMFECDMRILCLARDCNSVTFIVPFNLTSVTKYYQQSLRKDHNTITV